jgi:hypothetical protein
VSSGFTNGHEFNAQLTQFARKIQVAPQKVVKKVAFQLFRRIIEKTPVDTGRARASWNASIGSINPAVAPEGQHPKSASALAAKAATVLAGYGADGRLPVVWISNNLPYIGELENGHSRQAPAGMLKLSIMEEEAAFNQAWREAMSR